MQGDFVEVDWLARHRADPRVRAIDARSMPHGGVVAMPSGREQYAAGHIPGAVHLDYADDLRDPATPYAARVAPPDLFARVMGEHGIGDDTTVVAYDAGTIPFAARMVWMLRYYGHQEAYVLAGGFPAWVAAGYPVTTDVPPVTPATFTPRPHAELRATRDDVLAIAEGRGDAQLLETQRDQTYAQRDRDIKGAVRLSGNLLLEDARGGRVADTATLDRLVRESGIDPQRRTIVSCGSGVSASGAWLALREAGFRDVAVYDGSWMEWEHDALPTVDKSQRVVDELKQRAERATRFVASEPNGEALWGRVRETVDAMLTEAKRRGEIVDGYVRCDSSTMTQNDLDNGRLNVVVGVAPVKPAEFVIFEIGQWTKGTSTGRGWRS